MDEITNLEKKLFPKGNVCVVGCGRLGIRVVMDLVEVHRGGPEKIIVYDGATIDYNDIIHRKLGGKIGENKAKFAERFYPEKIIGVDKHITTEHLNLINEDVVIFCMAGGNTLKLREEIINYCNNKNIKTIGTNGVFGIDEKIKTGDGLYSPGPIEYANITKPGHIVVGTERYIKDGLPITPYTLNEISKKIVIECLKMLNKLK